MFKYKTLFLALSAVALSTGCTSWQSSRGPAFDIRPVQTVTHGNGNDNAQTLYEMGRYYQGQLRYDQAQDFYRRALAIEPQNVDALTGLGVALASQGLYVPALEAFKAAVALEPDSPYLLNNLGYVHWLLKDRERALGAYRQALRLDPLNARFRTNLRALMVDTANKPQDANSSKPDAAAGGEAKVQPVHLVLARSVLALNQVAPQVYELRMADAMAQEAPSPASSTKRIKLAEAATIRPVEAARVKTGGRPQLAYSLVVNEVAPRVYELQSSARAEASAAPVVLAALAVAGNKQPVASDSNIAPVATSSGKPGATSEIALVQAGPRVHERQAPALKAEAVAPAPVLKVALVAQASARPAMANTPVQQHTVQARPHASNDTHAGISLEVLNANGVKGIAGRVSNYLATQGYPSAGVGDHSRNETRTRIEYRPGYDKQARQLSALLPTPAALSKVAELGGDAKLRLVVGNDLRQGPNAWAAMGAALPEDGKSAAVPAASGLPLDVANGNGVKGIARKVADYLAQRGYRSASVYDMRPFNKSVTRIEYRKGYVSQAIKLGNQLPSKVAYVQSDRLRSNVRLVLGHDIKQNMAGWSPQYDKVKLAAMTAESRL